uniref:Uncharacterized protein n=1 Tax=Romanomermis culicivorax TaxID=13658 RepID=A0A915IJA6_ROMCU
MTSSGRIKAHVPGNLARYMFIKKCYEARLDATEEFMRSAGISYNPGMPREPSDPNDRDTDSEGDDF